MTIDPKFIVNLRGKDYPTWPGILDVATKAGLRSLTTRIVQIPGPENGHLAVVLARAEFEDGRVFEDIGDCSPASTSPQLAAAALRLASTRAKGRCLRDATNIGQTMLEELPNGQPEGDEGEETGAPRAAPTRAQGTSAPANGKPPEPHERRCQAEGCRKFLTAKQWSDAAEAGQPPYCTEHRGAMTGTG